ncbi:MAG: L,D-transpeptidase family protein [Microgenomates group bacterium]
MREIKRREFLSWLGKVTAGFTAWGFQEGLSISERLAEGWFYVTVQVDTLNIRSLPDKNSSVCGQVKMGAVLRVENKTIKGSDGSPWYKIIQNSNLRWPPKTEEYIWAGGVKEITDLSPISPFTPPFVKKIVISIPNQTLTAYESEKPIMTTPVSTGKKGWETPTGEFEIVYKRLERRMQGRSANSPQDNYDTPGVPYCCYLKNKKTGEIRGYAIHGAWWHNSFGQPVSHGCINLPLVPQETLGNISPAEWLFRWSTPVFSLQDLIVYSHTKNPGTLVIIE